MSGKFDIYTKKISNDFDNLADIYDDIWTFRVYDEIILEYIDYNKDKILEVGCGTGRLLSKMSHKSEEIIGIDVSKEMVKKARHNTDAKVINESIYNVDEIVEYNSLDVVVAENVLHNCKKFGKIARKLKSLLKKGGIVIVIDLEETNPKNENFIKSKIVTLMYCTFILKCGVMRGQIVKSIKGLVNETRMFNTKEWQKHISNVRDFKFSELENAFIENDFDTNVKDINVMFKLMVCKA